MFSCIKFSPQSQAVLAWNKVRLDLRQEKSTEAFVQKLKTLIFELCYKRTRVKAALVSLIWYTKNGSTGERKKNLKRYNCKIDYLGNPEIKVVHKNFEADT